MDAQGGAEQAACHCGEGVGVIPKVDEVAHGRRKGLAGGPGAGSADRPHRTAEGVPHVSVAGARGGDPHRIQVLAPRDASIRIDAGQEAVR